MKAFLTRSYCRTDQLPGWVTSVEVCKPYLFEDLISMYNKLAMMGLVQSREVINEEWNSCLSNSYPRVYSHDFSRQPDLNELISQVITWSLVSVCTSKNSQLATSMRILLHVLTSLKRFQVKRSMRLFTPYTQPFLVATAVPLLQETSPPRTAPKMKSLSIKLHFHLQFIIVKLYIVWEEKFCELYSFRPACSSSPVTFRAG